MIVSDIGVVIDMGIVDFLEYMSKASFSEANGLCKMLEVELGRVGLVRQDLHNKMEMSIQNVDPVQHDKLSRQFVMTYVVEQKIKDRIDLAKRYMFLKGVH